MALEEVEYELFVLHRMMQQLPTNVSMLLINQLFKVITAFNNERKAAALAIDTAVSDLSLAFTLQRFDLEATKRENDDLKR